MNDVMINYDFHNKTVLLIGGTGLIGFRFAKLLSLSGANIVLASRSYYSLKEKSIELANCFYFTFDISDVNSHHSLIEKAYRCYNSLDYVIICNGIHSSNGFRDIHEKDFDNVLNNGIKGVFFFIQALDCFTRYNDSKCTCLIVNSIASYKPAITPGQISKWAIRGFLEGVAADKGITKLKIFGVAPHRVVLENAEDGESNLFDVCSVALDLLQKPDKIVNGNMYIC